MSEALVAARALAERMGIAIDPESAPDDLATALAHAEEGCGRATRKEIRRTLYRLAQAGVARPARPIDPPTVVLGPAIDAWVSSIDGRGDRLVWLVREMPSGQHLLVAADVNEPAGLRDLRTFEVTRKNLRAMRRRFHDEARLTFVAADWRAIDALVIEAQDRLTAPDRRLDYRRIRSRLTHLPPIAPAELRSTHVTPPGDAERPRLVAESALLLREPELRTWWPRPDDVATFTAQVRAVRESRIVLAPAQQEERLREILVAAANQLYPALSTARRLEATAYVLGETGRTEAAGRALAVAQRLHEAGTTDIPLFHALTQQSVGAQLVAEESDRREDRAGALVLTPGELATARSPSRPPQARG